MMIKTGQIWRLGKHGKNHAIRLTVDFGNTSLYGYTLCGRQVNPFFGDKPVNSKKPTCKTCRRLMPKDES